MIQKCQLHTSKLKEGTGQQSPAWSPVWGSNNMRNSLANIFISKNTRADGRPSHVTD